MKKSLYFVFASACLIVCADVETIEEVNVNSDIEISVDAGRVKRIEYLSGTVACTISKTGGGILELAIIGNTNASIFVKEGTLKSVPPAKLKLEGDRLFHADAADTDSLALSMENGTNFVTRIGNSDDLVPDMYAEKTSSRPNPYLLDDALNGLPVFDFGSFKSPLQDGYGAAMEVSQKHIINEMLYVWQDYEGVENISLGESGEKITGPNPINWRYSYRGYGGGGNGYPMYYDAHGQITANLYVDGVKVTKSHVPSSGWHIVSAHSSTPITSKVSDYGFYGFGEAPSTVGKRGFGGFRLAEVIACTNVLSDADRTKAVCYLRRKWFGGDPVRRILVSDGACLDTSDATLKTVSYGAHTNAVNIGDRLLFADSTESLSEIAVVGKYVAKDCGESLNHNLAFEGTASITVPNGTAVVDRVRSSSCIIEKFGVGTLDLAFPDSSVTSLVVSAGTLKIDPLSTSRAYIHVDASDRGSMQIETVDGKELVKIWNDINGNGRYLKRSGENHAYGSKSVKNYPYLYEGFTNNLPVVDFGTFNDSEHQDGWGAELDLYPRVNVPWSEENPAVYNVFAIWGDREEAQDIPLYEGKEFPGPCLFGAGGAWYRGYGGGGNRFEILSSESSTMGNDNYVNGSFIDYVSWMKTYIPPERLFLQNSFIKEGVSVQQIGGNATQKNKNNGNAIRGVAGGLRLGELLLFRYHVPRVERFRIDGALRSKWFGSANEYFMESVVITNGAVAVFPYTDLAATNLMLEGSVSARSVAAKNICVLSDSTVSASLSLKSGGVLSFSRKEDGSFVELSADALSVEAKGRIEISDWEGLVCGQSFRIIKSSSISGAASSWKARRPDGAIKAHLEAKADGLYVTFVSGGTKIIVR